MGTRVGTAVGTSNKFSDLEMTETNDIEEVATELNFGNMMKVVQKKKKKLNRSPIERIMPAYKGEAAEKKKTTETKEESMECVNCEAEHMTAFSRTGEDSMFRELNVVSNSQASK